MLSIRQYSEADFDEMVKRWHETSLLSYWYLEEHQQHSADDAVGYFRTRILPECDVWVAEETGDLRGLLALSPGCLRQLAVFTGHQRRGIGTQLLRKAQELSPFGLQLSTFQRNSQARAFYERHGFRIVAFGVSLAPENVPDVHYRWLPATESHPLPSCPKDYAIRLATEDDVLALEQLIPLSVRALQASYYSPAQIEAALGPVFGVDYQLIRDGTYLVAERNEELVGCGGWSRRQALFGGDRGRPGEDALLDPARDAARIRAFFVHPAWARRGIGRSLLEACEAALQAAGFARAELVATLAGEPLYAAGGYSVRERYQVPLSVGLTLEVVWMTRDYPRRS